VPETHDHVAPYSRSPALARRKQLQDEWELLYALKPHLTKHGARGFPHKTRVRVDTWGIEWNVKEGAAAQAPASAKLMRAGTSGSGLGTSGPLSPVNGEKFLPWSCVRAIVPGLATPVLRSRLPKSKADLCFSIVGRDRPGPGSGGAGAGGSAVIRGRHLDLQASTREERDIWVEGLAIHLDWVRTRKWGWTARSVTRCDDSRVTEQRQLRGLAANLLARISHLRPLDPFSVCCLLVLSTFVVPARFLQAPSLRGFQPRDSDAPRFHSGGAATRRRGRCC
jgi:hypothetical protein